jgi:hypothetical protein
MGEAGPERKRKVASPLTLTLTLTSIGARHLSGSIVADPVMWNVSLSSHRRELLLCSLSASLSLSCDLASSNPGCLRMWRGLAGWPVLYSS